MSLAKVFAPTSYEQRQINDFEERVINGPLRPWLIRMAAEGYGYRALAEKTGLRLYTMRQLLKAWGIKTNATSKTYRSDGKFPLAFRLKQDGVYTISVAETVGRYMRAGMSYVEARDKALANRARVPLMRRLREDGYTDRPIYVQVHKWMAEGISYEDAVEIATKNRRQAA